MTGTRTDDTIGAPFLNLKDGESLVIGRPGVSGPVSWQANWPTGTSSSDDTPEQARARDDFDSALGAANIDGYGRLWFKREGDRIVVGGTVELVFDETYEFEPGLAGWLASITTKGALAIGSQDLIELAESGPAKVFRTTARDLRTVEGVIMLDEYGQPDPLLSRFVWSDFSPVMR